MKIEVEYLGGPACGRREQVISSTDGRPGELRIVSIPDRYESALDTKPSVPAEDHLYRRAGDRPGDGGVWSYTWSSGPLH